MALALKFFRSNAKGVGQKELRRLHSDLPDVGLSVLHQHDSYSADLKGSLNPKKKKVTPYTSGLAKLGSLSDPGVADVVSAGIQDQFNINMPNDMKAILGKKWPQALRYIVRANVYKSTSPGTWLRSVNGLCELVTWSFVRKHNRLFKKADRIDTRQHDRKRVQKYGVLLAEDRPLSKKYPAIFDEFRELNERRNDDLESHAIDEKTGRRPKPNMKSSEVKGLSKRAALGLKKVASKILELETAPKSSK